MVKASRGRLQWRLHKMIEWMAYVAADERGNAQFQMLLMIFMIIISIPFFWDIASVHYTRRMAEASSNSASLAAARWFAEQLTFTSRKQGVFRGRCSRNEFVPQKVLLRYRALPTFNLPTAGAQQFARQLAQANGSAVKALKLWLDFKSNIRVAGIPMPVIKVHTLTERRVPTAYGGIYQQPIVVPSESQAAVFLRSFKIIPRYCGDKRWTFDLDLRWFVSGQPDTRTQVECAEQTPILPPTLTPTPLPPWQDRPRPSPRPWRPTATPELRGCLERGG
jgi:hypothetical protein